MSNFVTIDKTETMRAVLRVVGVGGGGCNAVNSMLQKGLDGVEYIAVNTDQQALSNSEADIKLQIGQKVTKGLGAGADPNVGKKAAEEDREKIADLLQGSDMVFITTGMGGGTGTGAAPVIASIAKSMDALVVAIVTKPFKWEGKKRMLNAENGIQELKQYVDSLIVIPNERLKNVLDKNTSMFQAFDKPNEVLYEATRGIADIITIPGLVNVDFADVRTVMKGSGIAIMGCGISTGENRAVEAAQKAISSSLLEGINIKGAENVLINITGSDNITMEEITEGNNVISEAAGDEANVIFGCVQKDEMKDYISYTVIATGFNQQAATFEPTSEKKPKAEKQPHNKMTESFGFWNKNHNYDQDDLEVPTIFRVRKPSTLLDNTNQEEVKPKETPAEMNFNPTAQKKEDPKRTFGDEYSDRFAADRRKTGTDDTSFDDDEESSSFLRMIMD